jgi:hypothetical protein
MEKNARVICEDLRGLKKFLIIALGETPREINRRRVMGGSVRRFPSPWEMRKIEGLKEGFKRRGWTGWLTWWSVGLMEQPLYL